MSSTLQTYTKALSDLHTHDKELFTRIKILVYDLLYFSSNKPSQSRLESITENHYISTIHFTESQIEFLLNFPSSTGLTFAESIQASMAKKVSDSKVYEVCSSHDIAPIIMSFFCIQKGFKGEKAFKTALSKFEKDWRKSNN